MSIYKFTLSENKELKPTIKPSRKLHSPYKFYDVLNKHWLTVNPDGSWSIKEGYSWDGCSPKVKWFGHVLGTWDGPIHPIDLKQETYTSSLMHDMGYQALTTDRAFPYTRKMIDVIFYNDMKNRNFKLAGVYYGAVRVFGGLVLARHRFKHRWNKRK